MSTTDDGAAEVTDFEQQAWSWMHAKFTKVDLGHDPNDRDYGPDDMVDAFMAGRSGRAAPVEPAGDPVRDGGTWRPIETAPRTSTDVLVYCADTGEQFVAFWASSGLLWQYATTEESASICCAPTHWMPLPPPPGAAPQRRPDREAAITTLLTQVGSSHEAHPGAKRDLVRAFLARHGAEARGEVGAGDDAAFVERMELMWDTGSINYIGDASRERYRALARRGARAPVAGGEPVARWDCNKLQPGDSIFVRAIVKENIGASIKTNWPIRVVLDKGASETIDTGGAVHFSALYAHPPAPPAPTAERASVKSVMPKPPEGNNADEWLAHIREWGPSPMVAVQIADAIDAAARSKPPHGHQVPPAAPVGGVTEEMVDAARDELDLLACVDINGEDCQPRIDKEYVRIALEKAWAARPTPDDGCPKGDPDCLGGNGDCHDAGSTFAERGAVEAAVAAERERCVNIVEDFTTRWGEHVLRRYLVCSIRNIPIFEKSK